MGSKVFASPIKSALAASRRVPAAKQPNKGPPPPRPPPQPSSPASTYPDRTLVVRVHPAPRSLAERRSVMLALDRACSLEVFKKLSGRFLAVAMSAEAARRLVEQTTLRYRVALPAVLEGGQPNPAQAHMPLWGASLKPVLFPAAGTAVPLSLPRISDSPPIASSPFSVMSKEFVLTISSAPQWNHVASAEKDTTHGQAALADDGRLMPDTDGLEGVVLRKSVPAGVAARGLSRWNVDEANTPPPPAPNTAMAKARKEAKAREKWEAENLLPGAMLMRT